jgi:mono/diheme cytochrome c family protein
VTTNRLVALALLGCSITVATAAMLPTEPLEAQNDIVEHFKYGAVGTEERAGVPYWIFRVLPKVFPDKLPNRPGTGYERLGFTYEGERRDRPIGFTSGGGFVKLAGLNCATCHVGTVRDTATSPRRIIPGMPANRVDLQAYARFLTACAQDERFNASTLMDAIEKEGSDLNFFQRLTYRLLVVGRTRRGILERTEQNAWFDRRPPQGPGRVDTFNPYKVLFEYDMSKDDSVGTVELPSLWNQRMRQGMWLHWDGNNNSVDERNKSAAIGAGATPDSLDLPSLDRIAAWALDLKPPGYPPERIDRARAERGRPIYTAECSSCHEPGAAAIGQVTELAAIGTDPERLRSFTPDLAKRMNTIGEGRPWKFSHFRKTEGYANMPLDGLWLRAPYLHNGSVPTLRALLFPEERPATFYSAYDVYDWTNVGFVSTGADAEREGVQFDTRLKGNSNAGHVYGSKLTREQREDLLEFLKTL